jgi:hypothetical protein
MLFTIVLVTEACYSPVELFKMRMGWIAQQQSINRMVIASEQFEFLIPPINLDPPGAPPHTMYSSYSSLYFTVQPTLINNTNTSLLEKSPNKFLVLFYSVELLQYSCRMSHVALALSSPSVYFEYRGMNTDPSTSCSGCTNMIGAQYAARFE